MKKKLIVPIIILLSLFSVKTNAEIKPIVEGNTNAKVKLIIYESFTCSHCANFHKNIYPSLKKDFIDKGLISIEFKNFPLDIAALNASKVAHCNNDGSSDVSHYLYKNQSEWVKGNNVEDINKNLKNIIEKFDSLLAIKLDECIANTEIEDYILEDRINGAKKYKIQATPTLIINEKKFENTSDYKKLKKYLEKLI